MTISYASKTGTPTQGNGAGLATSVKAGLVGGSNGSAVAAGLIGEVITSTTITSTASTTTVGDVTNASIALTPGVWQIYYSVQAQIQPGSTAGNESSISVYLTNAANAEITNMERGFALKNPTSAAFSSTTALAASTVVNLSTATTYKLRTAVFNYTGTAVSANIYQATVGKSIFYAVRIA